MLNYLKSDKNIFNDILKDIFCHAQLSRSWPQECSVGPVNLKKKTGKMVYCQQLFSKWKINLEGKCCALKRCLIFALFNDLLTNKIAPLLAKSWSIEVAENWYSELPITENSW